jgi:membrane protease YdiL (CAAX protease family)
MSSSAPAATPRGIFSRADGRDRIAVPFWNGLLSALAAVAIGVAGLFITLVVLIFAAVLITGTMPDLNPGHPFVAATEAVVYVAAGAYAWWRLRKIGRNPFHPLTAHDVRTILIGVAALVVVRIGTAAQLILTNQTKHVQSGFEHFNVVTKVPTTTYIAVTLAVVSAVILAPIVEEMIFRALLFGALAPRVGVLGGALITALAFGAIHGDPILFPTLAALGFVAALAYAATGNLWVAVILHSLNNALGMVFLIGASLHAK